MNLWPTLKEWCQFSGTLTVELAIVFGVARIVATRIGGAQGRRGVWQSAVAAMLIVTLGELNGVRALVQPASKLPPTESQRAVLVTIKEPDFATQIPPMNHVIQSPAQVPTKGISRWEQPVRWPALVWLAGFVVIASRILLALVIAIVFRWSCRPAENPELRERAFHLRRALGIDRHVALIESTRAVAPFTFGIWRPVIVLPREFASAFTLEQQDAALAHELAHVAGFDSAWRCLSSLTCAFLWWHPFVWLTKRELDYASEVFADNASLLIANGPNRLVECLVACAKKMHKPALVAWLGMDGGGFRSALGKRVARLLQLSGHESVSRRVPWYVRVAAPAICSLSAWAALVLVGNPHPEKFAWRGSFLGSATAAGIESPPTKAAAEASTNNIAPKEAGLRRSTPTHGAAATNTEYTSLEKQAVYEKLRQIRLPEFGPIDNLPLSEVIRQISEEARRCDTEKKGINIVVSPSADLTGVAGLPGAPILQARDLNGVSIRLGSQLKDLTLEQVLNILTTIADRKINYSVEDFGIIISPKATEPVLLHTRFFKTDPKTLVESLKATQMTNRRSSKELSITNLIPTLTSFLNRAGVDLDIPGKTIYFNERIGALMVRATLQDLDNVEKAIEMLNTSPPQLTIRVKVLEVPVTAEHTAASWYMGSNLLLTNSPAATGTLASGDSAITGILTDEQFRQIVSAMEKKGGTDLMNAPEVTTLSGRQAQIKVVDIRYVVTDLDIDTNNVPAQSVIRPMSEPFELGPIVDVVPYVDADGYTIQMTVSPALKEFLGYEDPATVVPAIGRTLNYKGTEQPVPLPKFRLRQTATTARIYDGQTIMVAVGTAHTIQKDRSLDGGSTQASEEKAAQYQKLFNQFAALRARESELLAQYTEENPLVKRVREHIADTEQRKRRLQAEDSKLATHSEPVTKALFFFITPRIIDPAGNPIHSDEELKQLRKKVPAQARPVN